ncbi:MAG: MBL fold metallo-hydrolase [Proteobacteria bacterium]|nr:MBL fold metallo-hydrolase [Pseudomonadota bacterium]
MLLLLACGPPCPAPDPDGLLIEQLDLSGPSIGEAALLRAPDGSSMLFDVGNDGHDDEVAEALGRYGIEALDHVVLTHGDEDHVGGLEELLAAHPSAQVHRWDTVELPTEVVLGEVVVTLFLADGQLATSDGLVTLEASPEDDNARSLGGVVTWGDFTYLFAGDLPGGGKGTQDLEGAVVAHADALPWVPAGGVDVLHVNHHGISSSTSSAWTDWLRPRHAVVGANNSYLDAPSEEALAALAPWVEAVWVTEDGALGNEDARTEVVHGGVVVRVEEDGAYEVGPACP